MDAYTDDTTASPLPNVRLDDSLSDPADFEPFDTIAAIATPPGRGGVGVVRISGPDAFAVGRAIFRPGRRAAPLTAGDEPRSHLLTYGRAVDPETGQPLDEVLAVFMLPPRTYTREPVVEIQAHGGPLLLQRILAAALTAGARAARAGELTERAFVHGRLDLAQAEAVMALIASESEAARRLALRQLEGALSQRVQAARAPLLAALVRIEASVDFPEEEVPLPDPAELGAEVGAARAVVADLLAGADQGRVLREGLRVALIGRPNVGKSSLLNALLRVERAIVTPIAGTTRDTIEEQATLGGVALHLVDTAGVTETEDPIERLGVERSRAAAQSADVVLFVLDGSVPLADDDRRVAAELRALLDIPTSEEGGGAAATGRAVLLALNKADLPPAITEAQAQALWPGVRLIHSSTRAADGIAALEQALTQVALGERPRMEEPLVASVRHADALRRCHASLAAAGAALDARIPLDLVALDLRAALDALGEITGETASEHLLEAIFSTFCIGK